MSAHERPPGTRQRRGVFLFAAVALGAFGAHALKAKLAPDLMAVYQTAVQYHFWHALGLLAVGILLLHKAGKRRAGGGRVAARCRDRPVFCGSLYALALTGVRGWARWRRSAARRSSPRGSRSRGRRGDGDSAAKLQAWEHASAGRLQYPRRHRRWPRPRERQSTFAPDSFTTFAHFAVSAWICRAKSSGVPPAMFAPTAGELFLALRVR